MPRVHLNNPLLFSRDDCGQERVCEMDLEGIVAKHSFGPYITNRDGSTGSKSEILNIPRWMDAKNSLSASATMSQLPDGIPVN